MRHLHLDCDVNSHDDASSTKPVDPPDEGSHSPATCLDPLGRIAIALDQLNATLAARGLGRDASEGSAASWASVARDIARIADKLDPPPPDIINSTAVAGRLGCTTTWVAEMARQGKIPANCLVPGTGNGKPWKFYRTKVDAWLATR